MAQQQQARGRRTGWQVLLRIGVVVAVIAAVSVVLFVINVLFIRHPLWDWLKLLIIPVVLAAGGLWFNYQQRKRELQIADRRAQDEALQAYLDQMSDMLIPSKDLPSLYKARPGDSLSSVARARTLTVLKRLDGDGKARVVQFLYEAGLIMKNRRVLDLENADLNGANLDTADLRNADLSDAYLRGARLVFARLQEADLSGTFLDKADLRGAYLNGAVLSNTRLREADLRGVRLTGAELWGVRLTGAELWGVHLTGANLEDAKGVNNEELDQAVRPSEELSRETHVVYPEGPIREEQGPGFLEGATMPNGQKYEDWLKSKGGGEDEQNTGAS